MNRTLTPSHKPPWPAAAWLEALEATLNFLIAAWHATGVGRDTLRDLELLSTVNRTHKKSGAVPINQRG